MKQSCMYIWRNISLIECKDPQNIRMWSLCYANVDVNQMSHWLKVFLVKCLSMRNLWISLRTVNGFHLFHTYVVVGSGSLAWVRCSGSTRTLHLEWRPPAGGDTVAQWSPSARRTSGGSCGKSVTMTIKIIKDTTQPGQQQFRIIKSQSIDMQVIILR